VNKEPDIIIVLVVGLWLTLAIGCASPITTATSQDVIDPETVCGVPTRGQPLVCVATGVTVVCSPYLADDICRAYPVNAHRQPGFLLQGTEHSARS
jgi:hypothetical protein